MVIFLTVTFFTNSWMDVNGLVTLCNCIPQTNCLREQRDN